MSSALASLFIIAQFMKKNPPNKAPEPTTCSGTPRAIVCLFEMKLQTEVRNAARVVPEQAVAHL
jgi:hypothetical protein